MTDYIRVSAMPAYLIEDHPDRPLWIRADYEPDTRITVPRPVASVVADVDNPGEWIITYSRPLLDCRSAVRAAGDRRFAMVDTHLLESPDRLLVARVPVGAACHWAAMCTAVAVALRPHPVFEFVPVCACCARL